jgi:hypothetical protein
MVPAGTAHDGAVADVVGDLRRVADGPSGQDPVPEAVLPDRTDRGTGPVVDSLAVGALASGQALPRLLWQSPAGAGPREP